MTVPTRAEMAVKAARVYVETSSINDWESLPQEIRLDLIHTMAVVLDAVLDGGDDVAEVPAESQATRAKAMEALTEHFTLHPRTDPEGIAHNAIAVLLNLPIDVRMGAMSLVEAAS